MSNRFALLAEDGGSGDEGITSVPDKTEKPAASGVSAKKVAPAPNATKGNQQAQAGGRKDFFPGRTGQGRKVLSEDGPRETKENTKRAGGETRGSARGRGGRGRGRNPRPDRHSQMDRETSGKADHQAWGGDDGQRELDDETNAQNDADREANASGVATPADPNAPSTPAPAEEEDKTQSYAEYLAAQVAATGESLAEKLGLKKEARQANEGADEAQWKNAKIFSKDDDDSFFAGEAKDKKNKNKQKEGKTFIEIDAPAYRPQTAGRGGARGGRGGSRGAPRGSGAPRGRGAPRGGNNGARSQRAGGPDLSEAAFPSLS